MVEKSVFLAKDVSFRKSENQGKIQGKKSKKSVWKKSIFRFFRFDLQPF